MKHEGVFHFLGTRWKYFSSIWLIRDFTIVLLKMLMLIVILPIPKINVEH